MVNQGPILVLDDTPDARFTISGILRDEGYEVHPASTRAEALQLLDSYHFAAAVLDVRLDESDEENLDGLHLMREINLLSPATAIIILTGFGTKKIVEEALRPDKDGFSPAYDFLDKEEAVYKKLPDYVRKAIEHHAQTKRYQPRSEIEKVLFESLRTRFSEIGQYNILVEGITDKQYLELAAERYFRKTGVDLLDGGRIRFIASVGTKKLAPLFGPLQLLERQGIRFVVILDGDDVGRLTSKSMRQFGLQKNRHFFQLERKDYIGKDGRSWEVEIEDLVPWRLMEGFISKYPGAVEEKLERDGSQKVVIRGRPESVGKRVVDYKLELAEYVRQHASKDDLKAFVEVIRRARSCMDL